MQHLKDAGLDDNTIVVATVCTNGGRGGVLQTMTYWIFAYSAFACL